MDSRLKPEPSGGRPWEAASGQRHPSRPASRRSIRQSRHLEPDRLGPRRPPKAMMEKVLPRAQARVRVRVRGSRGRVGAGLGLRAGVRVRASAGAPRVRVEVKIETRCERRGEGKG